MVASSAVCCLAADVPVAKAPNASEVAPKNSRLDFIWARNALGKVGVYHGCKILGQISYE